MSGVQQIQNPGPDDQQGDPALEAARLLAEQHHNVIVSAGGLIPVHRKLFQLLVAGKLKQCAALLAQHLDDSEARLGRVMAGQHLKPGAANVGNAGKPASKMSLTFSFGRFLELNNGAGIHSYVSNS